MNKWKMTACDVFISTQAGFLPLLVPELWHSWSAATN